MVPGIAVREGTPRYNGPHFVGPRTHLRDALMLHGSCLLLGSGSPGSPVCGSAVFRVLRASHPHTDRPFLPAYPPASLSACLSVFPASSFYARTWLVLESQPTAAKEEPINPQSNVAMRCSIPDMTLLPWTRNQIMTGRWARSVGGAGTR